MTDRISEIKSLLETLSLKLAAELQSQREEIEELRAKVSRLEREVAERPNVVAAESMAETMNVTYDEFGEGDQHNNEEGDDPIYEDVHVVSSVHAVAPVVESEESIFTVTDLKDVRSVPRVTVSDMFAATSTIADVARSKSRSWMVDIPGPKVEMIQSALTFNDRLTFIRDLFDGDSEQFNITLDRINETSTFDEVVSDMRDAYPEWDEESDLVYRFYMEVRRRFRD